MPKNTVITVGQFKNLLKQFAREGKVTDATELWVSSDEEGNSYSPVIQSGDTVNIGTETNASKLTLYPSSSHSVYP